MPTNLGWIVVGGGTTFVIVLTVVATRWGPRWWKAAMFGSAAAIAFAFTAALIKVVSNYAANDWVTMFEHWQTYGVVAFGLLGLFLTQNAFHAGPLAASQSTLVLVDPLVSICLGIALYGDSLRTSGPYGPLEAALAAGHVHGRRVPLQLAAGHRHEERGQGGRVRRDAVAAAQAPVRAPSRTAGCPSRPPRPAARTRRARSTTRRVIGGEVIRVREVRAVLGPLNLVDDRSGHVRAQPLHARRWCGCVVGPPMPNTDGTPSAVTSKGGPSPRRLRRSATSAGPSARRSALPCSVRRAQAAAPTIREKKRSASSPGSSAIGRPAPGPRPAGRDGSRARAWAARRRRWRRRPPARPAPRPPRRRPRGCGRSATTGPLAGRPRLVPN